MKTRDFLIWAAALTFGPAAYGQTNQVPLASSPTPQSNVVVTASQPSPASDGSSLDVDQSAAIDNLTSQIPNRDVVVTTSLPSLDEVATQSINTNQLLRARPLGLRASGLLPAIQRSRNPLQLINPFAPASYGGLPISEMYVGGESGGIALFRLEF